MKSRAHIMGHPIHPMLIGFPVTLYVVTLVSLIVFQFTKEFFWFRVALGANTVGIASAALAAVPGAIDGYAVPKNSRARNKVLAHALLNCTALVVFALSCWWLWAVRNDVYQGLVRSPDVGVALYLSLLGVLLTAGAGIFGSSLVQDHHIGIANLPSSNATQPLPNPSFSKPHVASERAGLSSPQFLDTVTSRNGDTLPGNGSEPRAAGKPARSDFAEGSVMSDLNEVGSVTVITEQFILEPPDIVDEGEAGSISQAANPPPFKPKTARPVGPLNDSRNPGHSRS